MSKVIIIAIFSSEENSCDFNTPECSTDKIYFIRMLTYTKRMISPGFTTFYHVCKTHVLNDLHNVILLNTKEEDIYDISKITD